MDNLPEVGNGFIAILSANSITAFIILISKELGKRTPQLFRMFAWENRPVEIKRASEMARLAKAAGSGEMVIVAFPG